METIEKELLENLYENYKAGLHNTNYNYPSDQKEKMLIENAANYLAQKGYIDFHKIIKGWSIKLTAKGIDLIKNNYVENNYSNSLTINGSTTITGSNNVIGSNSGTINLSTTIPSEINQLDIPEEYKQLINELLNEIKINNLPKDKFIDKCKDTLIKITSGTISSLAIKAITSIIVFFAYR